MRKVYIKYDGKGFYFATDRRRDWEDKRHVVRIPPTERIRWIAKKQDINLDPFDGFEVEFTQGLPFPTSPPASAPASPSSPDHETESGAANNNPGGYPYKVKLNPEGNGPETDPEVRVEEPGVDQGMATCVVELSAIPGKLDCSSVTVQELDLVRVALDDTGFDLVDFNVSFPRSSPLCEATARAGGLRIVRNTNVTFWYQVQPVQHVREFTYRIEIPSLKLEGEGMVTVLPRAPGGQSAA